MEDQESKTKAESFFHVCIRSANLDDTDTGYSISSFFLTS